MNRIARSALLLAVALLLLLVSPVAAQAPTTEQSMIFGVRNDVTLAAGESADAVIVVQASGTVEGRVKTLVVIDGTATVTGPSAEVDQILAIGATVNVGPGARVDELGYVDSDITIDPTATVTEQRDVEKDLAGAFAAIGVALLAALFLVWIGGIIALLVAGLLVAGLAGWQARRAGSFIGGETLKVLIAGLVMFIVPPIVIVLLMATVIGIPLALLLLALWGLAVFLGYIVVGIKLGEWILGVGRRRAPSSKPYGAALLGLIVLMLLGLIPFVAFIAGWLGLGAVSLAAWRVLRGRPPELPPAWGAPGGWYPPPPPPAWQPQPGWGPPPGYGAGPDAGYGQGQGWGGGGQGWAPPPSGGWDQGQPTSGWGDWQQPQPPTSGWDQPQQPPSGWGQGQGQGQGGR